MHPTHHAPRRLAAAAARWLGLAAVACAGLASLVGSGGGGGGGDPPATGLTVISTSPTNGATGVVTGTAVSATFSENLTANPTFTLNGGGGNVAGTITRAGSTATFTPAAALAQGITYTASVSGGVGASGGTQSGTTTWSFTAVAAPGSAITLSGTADFQSVPNDTATTSGRLLYANVTNRPIRGATVQVVSSPGGTVLATGTTSATGTYALTIPAAQPVIVRVRAEMKKTTGAGGTWDFTVRDNTQGDALYVLDSAVFTPTAGTNTQNLRALSGQTGTSAVYTGTRAAGPFSILDVVYDAKEKLLTASPNAVFPALQLMWSVNNRPASGGGGLSAGLIGTSFYQLSTPTGHRIYILGAADTDTDEYDRPVVAHEFGHYMQSAFSRDDSIGGSHSGSDRLDMRVAFSEGWGNAWSGMALASQYYTDSLGPQQQQGFRLDLAASPPSNRGWYSEASVQHLLYQWHASGGIGFTPIWSVMSAFPQSLPADGALSSIHSFAHRLKQAVPAQAATIDTQLTAQSITVADAIGTGEGNNGGVAIALPVYRQLSLNVTQNVCVTDAAASAGEERNKLAANVFIRLPLAAAATRTITVTATTAGSDPDFVLTRPSGIEDPVYQGTGSTEVVTLTGVSAGTYLIVLYDYTLTRNQITSGTGSGQGCFNVTVQ